MTATSVPVTPSSSEPRWSPDPGGSCRTARSCARNGLHLSDRHAGEARPAAAVDALLSRGYTSLVWIPVVFGYSVTSSSCSRACGAPPGARRCARRSRRRRVGGLGVALLGLLVDNFDLRDPLVNWSRPARRYSSPSATASDSGSSSGWSSGHCAASGVRDCTCSEAPCGSTSHPWFWRWSACRSSRRRPTDLLQGLKLEFISDAIYAKQGGLTVSGAVIVSVLTVAGLTMARLVGANEQTGPRARRRGPGRGRRWRARTRAVERRHDPRPRRPRHHCAVAVAAVPRRHHERAAGQRRPLPAARARAQHRGRPRRHSRSRATWPSSRSAGTPPRFSPPRTLRGCIPSCRGSWPSSS